jgi:D-serine deaminase-like pyridoxal phosphate-dependent protein
MVSHDDGLLGEAAVRSRALRLYAQLAESLLTSIEKLRALPDDVEGAKGRARLIREHQKAVQTVIDFEVRLGKPGTENGEGGGSGLDLEAAREEIHRRLARFRASGGG